MSTETNLRILLVDENKGRSTILKQTLGKDGHEIIAALHSSKTSVAE
jgi:CheY-like chemotaxis protein